MTSPTRHRSPLVDPPLAAALRTLVILSPFQYSFAGRAATVTQPPAGPQQTATGINPSAMTDSLQLQLYTWVYNRRFDGREPAVPQRMTELTEELSLANAGRERWDPGWQVFQALGNGVVQAHKHGRSQMFYPGQYLPLHASGATQGAVAPGAYINAYLAKEMRHFQEGFYIALSETVQPWYEQMSLVRVYFHLRADGAASVLQRLTSRFNRFQVPFRFKCLAFRELYDRFDAGVLFVGRRQWDITALLLSELYSEIKDLLEADVPLCTKRLAPGVALAEDPNNGDSFGMTRCRLIAEGIWSAYMSGLQTEQARLEHIAAAFARAGLAIDRPWLSPGSADIYDLSLD